MNAPHGHGESDRTISVMRNQVAGLRLPGGQAACVVDNQVDDCMVQDLIRRARRRFLLNETLAQFAFAAAVFIAGFVLILTFGTRYLEWWTLAIFACIGIVFGAWRVHRATPTEYATAIRLDQNARLNDALSTALYFAVHTDRAASGAFREGQLKQAESAAGTVQLSEAVPFIFPRSLYAVAALCVLASGLIALRYGFGHGLNLRAPITTLLFEDEAIRDAKKAQALYPKSQNQWMQEAQSLLSKLGMQQKPNEPAPGDAEALTKAIEQALQNPPENSGTADKEKGSENGGQAKSGEGSKDQQGGDPIENPDQQQQASDQPNGQQGADSKNADSNTKSASGKSGSQNNQSLLSRLKDAVSNLLSKSNNGDKSSGDKNQESAKNDQQNGPKGQPGRGAQQQGDSSSSAQDGETNSDAQNAQQAQGRLNNSSDQKNSQGGSGIGSQNGDKEVREAAQLKAMGKISEIIGQRAATVSGETSVEVQSGSQKLHTDYSNVNATHGEADSDVTRDEIPLALQSYVQQYFAEVRKSGESAKGKAAPKQ